MGPSGHMWGVNCGKLNPTHEGHSQFQTQNDLPHEKDSYLEFSVKESELDLWCRFCLNFKTKFSGMDFLHKKNKNQKI